MKAIRVHEYGGADQLVLHDVQVPAPGPGEALIEIEAIGVNFIDVYHRSGLYKGNLPFTPGMEASGRIAALGPDVTTELKVGDRVAYAMVLGAYAEYAVVPAQKLVPVPDHISAVDAAALMLQGMTAHYLANSTVTLEPGMRCLVHAAAGGVGLLLIQIAKLRGATVYGTVSTEEKAQLARKAGADAVILYSKQDFASEIKALTAGSGVDVVYDSVGAATFEGSLNCLRPRGTLALFGQSSGPVASLDPQLLNAKGSLFLTRPSLGHYTLTRDELLSRARELFEWLQAGMLDLRVDRVLPLADAAVAHRLLESRKTSGKLVLTP